MAKHAFTYPNTSKEFYDHIVNVNGYDVVFIKEKFILPWRRVGQKPMLPTTVALDTKETIYAMGILMKATCTRKHDHITACKPTVLCDNSCIDQLLKTGTLQDNPSEEKPMEIWHCNYKNCIGSISFECARKLKLLTNETDPNSVDTSNWSCPICHSTDINKDIPEVDDILNDVNEDDSAVDITDAKLLTEHERQIIVNEVRIKIEENEESGKSDEPACRVLASFKRRVQKPTNSDELDKELEYVFIFFDFYFCLLNV